MIIAFPCRSIIIVIKYKNMNIRFSFISGEVCKENQEMQVLYYRGEIPYRSKACKSSSSRGRRRTGIGMFCSPT